MPETSKKPANSERNIDTILIVCGAVALIAAIVGGTFLTIVNGYPGYR